MQVGDPTYTSRAATGSGTSQTCAYCNGFANIPTLIRGSDGRVYMNPDAEQVKRFHLAADPFGGVLGTLNPGQTREFTFTVPAEEESLGDMLVNELMALFNPANARNITVDFLNIQTDRLFQNAPIFNTLIFGDAFLNCCLPCCFLVQATNSLTMRVTNGEAVPVEVRIVARGKRFLPKDDEFRARMLMYWNTIPSYPYFLTLDQQEVVVPSLQTVTATMTVQGTGDFEVKWPRCEILGVGGNPAPNIGEVLLSVADGVGREWQSNPMPMDAFVATPTLVVPGMPGNLFRAAAACHCPPFSQLFKRNTIIRHTFTNTSANDARIRLTYAGCFHQVPECPPGRSMDRIRSLEPTIGPLLIPQRDYCPPQEEYLPAEDYPEPYQEFAPAPMPMAAPAPFIQPQQQVPVQQGYRPTEGSTHWAKSGGLVVGNPQQTGYRPVLGDLGQYYPSSPPRTAPVVPPGMYYDTIARQWRRVR
jgi:hypothetical protein